MPDSKDYYLVLGISPNATLEEIRAARREKLQFYHPDKWRDDQNMYRKAEEETKRVNETFNVLSNPELRARYDRQRGFGGVGPTYGGTYARPAQTNTTNKAEQERKRQAAAAEASRKAKQEQQRKAAEATAARKAEEERRRKAEAAEAARKAEQERQRKTAEAARKAEEEEQRQRATLSPEEIRRKTAENRQRQAAEEEEKRRIAEDEKWQQTAMAESTRLKIVQESKRMIALLMLPAVFVIAILLMVYSASGRSQSFGDDIKPTEVGKAYMAERPTPEPTLAPIFEPTATNDPDGLAVAIAGVNTNTDWIPFRQDFDGVTMVLVPKGCFKMGGYDGDEQPINWQCFNAPFWIDLVEATEGGLFRVNVTWDQATAYCQERGARLPTEAEWEYVARGPDNLTYIWGNELPPDIVGDYSPKLGGYIVTKGDIRSLQETASWVGALNMSSNVSEWVSSWYVPYPYNIIDGREDESNPNSYEYHVLRGGSTVISASGLVRSSFRTHASTSFLGITIGFRCARSYEP